MDNHLLRVQEEEENVIKNVLKVFLGREVHDEDAKKCARGIVNGNPDEYLIAYEGTHLGKIVKTWSQNMACNIEFIPNKTFR